MTGGEQAIEGSINFIIEDSTMLPNEFGNFLINNLGYTILEIRGN